MSSDARNKTYLNTLKRNRKFCANHNKSNLNADQQIAKLCAKNI